MKKESKKDSSEIKWFITIFALSFVLSVIFSFISTSAIGGLSILPAVLVLFLVIFLGIVFDVIGVAVTVANEQEFHAKASKKVEGSKDSLKLIKNAPRVANICADVIGDIAGVLSGAISALIALKIYEQLGISIQFILSAAVAALTVGGKAIGKNIANENSTKIVHSVGIFLNKFSKK